ncbi:MAG: hypothetical protein KDB07_08075, partial [Planctomycetes bacterium]|nr:hypothetical protein [Planctomycetota bacterium]
MKQHAPIQHYGMLNIDNVLSKPEHVIDAITDHYGLENVEPPREAVLHFVQYLQLRACAEDLGDMVLAAYHLLHGVSELDIRRNEARTARREWQATGLAQGRSDSTTSSDGSDLRERFQRARHRAETLEEKVAGLAELVAKLCARHVRVRSGAAETAKSMEGRRQTTVDSQPWQANFEKHFERVHEEAPDMRWAPEHERLSKLWGERVPNDYRDMVIDGVHAYLAEVDELVRALDTSMTSGSLTKEEKQSEEERVRGLRRLSAYVVDQIERARALPDMLAIEARALEELMIAPLPGIGDLKAAQKVKFQAQTRTHYKGDINAPRAKAEQPRVHDQQVSTPSQRQAAVPAPAPAMPDPALEREVRELRSQLAGQGRELEALLESKLNLE